MKVGNFFLKDFSTYLCRKCGPFEYTCFHVCTPDIPFKGAVAWDFLHMLLGPETIKKTLLYYWVKIEKLGSMWMKYLHSKKAHD